MRLIDADALPQSWQPGCNGNRTFVDSLILDAAPAIKDGQDLARHDDGGEG
jgi:hypothetical protein